MSQIHIKIYISILFLIICTSSFSQDQSDEIVVGFGSHSGWSTSNIKFVQGVRDTNVVYESLSYVNGGLVVNLMAERFAGIQIEANLSNRGWKETVNGVYTYRRDMKYLEIPVLTHLAFGKKRLRYIINFGPYVAFQQSSTESYVIFDNQIDFTADSIAILGETANPIDLGFIIDAGFGVKTLIGNFHLKGRYSSGVIDLFEEYPQTKFRQSKMRSVYVGLSYYYNFHFNRRD